MELGGAREEREQVAKTRESDERQRASGCIKEDKIPAIRFSKRSIRIDPRDLENFIKERKDK